MIEQFDVSACLFSWLLIQTGDQELGAQLLQQTTTYQTQDLPAAIEHSDYFPSDVCHLTAGDTEKAYKAIETRLSHGHQPDFRVWLQLHMYEQIRYAFNLDEMVPQDHLLRHIDRFLDLFDLR